MPSRRHLLAAAPALGWADADIARGVAATVLVDPVSGAPVVIPRRRTP